MARLLTGREAAAALTAELRERAAALALRNVTPRLAILRCGENEADGAYLRGALKRGALCGVDVAVRTLPETVSPSTATHPSTGACCCGPCRPICGTRRRRSAAGSCRRRTWTA